MLRQKRREPAAAEARREPSVDDAASPVGQIATGFSQTFQALPARPDSSTLTSPVALFRVVIAKLVLVRGERAP
jgi:hypothetical protein